MRLPSKLILQTVGFFAVIGAAAVFFAREPASRFFKINRAHYHANISEWRKSLDILEKIEPQGTQARAYAQVKMDALMQLAYPIGAIGAWEQYTAGRDENAPVEYEPLYGFALMLGLRFDDARAHFGLGQDEFAKAMAEYLASPTGDNYKRARDLAAVKYEKRWLYVGLIEWLEGRHALAQSRNERALVVLRALVERFPRQVVFGFDLGQAYLGSGDIGLACSYLLSGYQGLPSRYPAEEAGVIRDAWRKIVAQELVMSIYSGNPIVALRIMRALGAPLELDLRRPATILLSQDDLSPAVAFELHAMLNSQPKLRQDTATAKGAMDRERDWLAWFTPALAGQADLNRPSPERVLSISKLTGGQTVALSADGLRQWNVSVPAPPPAAGRRLVLLRLKSEAVNGVGGAYVFNMGWKADTGYASEQPRWQAFDLPLTVGDPLELRLQLRTDSLPGIDQAEQTGARAITIDGALLVDFKRAAGPAAAAPATKGSD
jgi:hypothetical protein